MYHELRCDASFWAFLFRVDQDLAETCRQEKCACGGRLHVADYPRKPRGARGLPEPYRYRLSFCCDRDGCRKRKTPPSVRFLGRKVYLGVVVILVTAMRQGATPRRVRELSQAFGADRQTIARWRVFWTELVPQTKFWQVARARLLPLCELVALPLSLIDLFVHTDQDRDGWRKLLTFLAPITITGGLEIKVSQGGSRSAEDDSRRVR
jgi:hypothetical protein